MKNAPLLFLIAAATTPVAAQSVSASVVAMTPVTVQSLTATGTDSQSLLAGPLPSVGMLTSSVQSLQDSAGATVTWSVEPTPFSEELVFRSSAQTFANGGTGVSVANVLQNELVLELSSSAPRRVWIIGSTDVTASVGAPAPMIEVDVNADGVVDWSGQNPGFQFGLDLDAQPVSVLVRTSASLVSTSTFDSASAGVELRIRPDNTMTIDDMVSGCLPFLICEQAFAHEGIRLQTGSFGFAVAILGLGVQPGVLSTLGPVPCLLLPSPDALELIGPNGYDLDIPDAVRPISVYTQGVLIWGGGLVTSDGYRIYAF